MMRLGILTLFLLTVAGCDEERAAEQEKQPPGEAKLAGFLPGSLLVCAVVDGVDTAGARLSYWGDGGRAITLTRGKRGLCAYTPYDWQAQGLTAVLSIAVDAGGKKPTEVGVYSIESPSTNPAPEDFKYVRAVPDGDAYRLRIEAQAPAIPVVKLHVRVTP